VDVDVEIALVLLVGAVGESARIAFPQDRAEDRFAVDKERRKLVGRGVEQVQIILFATAGRRRHDDPFAVGRGAISAHAVGEVGELLGFLGIRHATVELVQTVGIVHVIEAAVHGERAARRPAHLDELGHRGRVAGCHCRDGQPGGCQCADPNQVGQRITTIQSN
jgi:hypothetical protein